MKKNTAILLIHCSDQKGIVMSVTSFLYKNKGNIIDIQQHVEANIQYFFMRVEWELTNFCIDEKDIEKSFYNEIGKVYNMYSELFFSHSKPRVALFVSKVSHCLYDILQRYSSKEWAIDIPLIISNHENLRDFVEKFNIPFHYLPINKENKINQEQKEIELLQEHDVDVIILARYMQILSENFVSKFPNKIINVHHSFLPAFIGSKPYHAAHKRGVKIIGATSHYVTSDLDEGPIIAQKVTNVSHKHTTEDLIRKGKDLEKIVLSEALWLQTQHRILTFKNRTIIF